MRLLLVEDDQMLADGIKQGLSSAGGYVVDAVGSAESALDAMTSDTFDAAIIDVGLPGMNGMEMYGEILKNHPAISKKVLFVTGDTLSEEIQVFLRVSNATAISKPFAIVDLLGTLNRMFEG